MILKFELPQEAVVSISLTEGERIYYSVPFDISEDGGWLQDSYFVVTNRRLFVIRHKKVETAYDIADCAHVKAEAKIGGGLLVMEYKGVKSILCR